MYEVIILKFVLRFILYKICWSINPIFCCYCRQSLQFYRHFCYDSKNSEIWFILLFVLSSTFVWWTVMSMVLIAEQRAICLVWWCIVYLSPLCGNMERTGHYKNLIFSTAPVEGEKIEWFTVNGLLMLLWYWCSTVELEKIILKDRDPSLSRYQKAKALVA